NGKVVLLISDSEPKDAQGHSLITGTETASDWVTSRTKRLQNITSKNPKLIIAVSSTLKETLERAGGLLSQPRITLDEGTNNPSAAARTTVINISTEMADLLLERAKTSIAELAARINETGQPQSRSYKARLTTTFGSVTEPFIAYNVLGYLE